MIGTASESKLVGVYQDLVRVVYFAHDYVEQQGWSPLSFIITEGVRNEARQKMLVAAGASQTMNSRHLTGHAVDVAATLDGEVSYDWPLYYKLAYAFRAGSIALNVPIVWGGVWDRRIDELPSELDQIDDSVAEYVARRKAMGRKALLDGPHFELDRGRYPA